MHPFTSGLALSNTLICLIVTPIHPLFLEVAKCVTRYCEAQVSSPWLSYKQSNCSAEDWDPQA